MICRPNSPNHEDGSGSNWIGEAILWLLWDAFRLGPSAWHSTAFSLAWDRCIRRSIRRLIYNELQCYGVVLQVGDYKKSGSC